MALSNKEIPTDLREYIEINILPQYATFDKAHRLNHAEKVIEESMKLAQYYEVEPAMVYTIAAYHDLGLCEGREFHHLISGKILAADEKLRKWFSEAQLQTMKEAVEDHRASNKQAPRSMYGKIVAEADRIINPEVSLRRAIQYGLSNYPELDEEAQYERAVAHLRSKYAYGGYLKLWIPQSSNAYQLEKLRAILTDESKLRSIFERLYKEEIQQKGITQLFIPKKLRKCLQDYRKKSYLCHNRMFMNYEKVYIIRLIVFTIFGGLCTAGSTDRHHPRHIYG